MACDLILQCLRSKTCLFPGHSTYVIICCFKLLFSFVKTKTVESSLFLWDQCSWHLWVTFAHKFTYTQQFVLKYLSKLLQYTHEHWHPWIKWFHSILLIYGCNQMHKYYFSLCFWCTSIFCFSGIGFGKFYFSLVVLRDLFSCRTCSGFVSKMCMY